MGEPVLRWRPSARPRWPPVRVPVVQTLPASTSPDVDAEPPAFAWRGRRPWWSAVARRSRRFLRL